MTSDARRQAYLASGAWDAATLVGRVRAHARETPHTVAVVDLLGQRRRSYAELEEDARRVAGFLLEAGVAPGDVVAVQLPNRYETVAIALGVLMAGAVINPMLPVYRSRELRYMLTVGRTCVMFLPDSYRGHDHVSMVDALGPEVPYLTTRVVVPIEGGAGGPALPGRRPGGGSPPSEQGGAGGPALPGRRPRGGTPPSGQGGSPATLLLVGDGPLRDELAALAHELGIGGLVRFAGHQAEPTPFVDAMDVFVLAVPAGSMSIALLETMARGVPPVITFCGPEEAVIDEQTGLCAPPDDPVGLGCVLERLAADAGLRRRMGAAAAEHVGSEFSAARVADDLLAVYGVRTGGLPDRLRVAQG